MTSTIWTRALDVLGVSQYAEFPEIESAYRTRLHNFNFKFARGPNSKAQTDEDFWKIKQAYHLIFNLNKVKQSLEALTDDEYQRYLDGFDAMQFKDIAPTWGELREQTQFLHQVLESNNTLLSLKRLISYNTAQSRWIFGLNSCLTLHSDLISTILGAKEGRPSHKTHPGHENTQDELNAALRGGTSQEDSQQVNIELPLILAGQHIMATPDTGSDSNVISATMAKQLGLHLKRCSSHDAFKLANGCVIACKGQVSTQFSFPSEETSPLSIEFHVLEPLATSIIVGRIFLDATKTLTAHLDRLIRSPRPCEVALCPPRILHLNPPRRTLQCFINSIQVEANADTGAEMNLASPEFAARSGFSIEPTDQQHQFAQLADGSIASISGCFRARFNPSEKPSTKTLRPRAHMKTFYILDGLTSDILLSRHLIFEIYAFVEQANAFSEMERPDLHAELNLIAWLNRWRSKSGSRPIQHTSISEKYFAFWSEIDVDDAREQRLHQQRKLEASRIQIQEDREAAEDAESQRHGHYNQRRQRRIQTHNAEMALLGRNG